MLEPWALQIANALAALDPLDGEARAIHVAWALVASAQQYRELTPGSISGILGKCATCLQPLPSSL